MNELTTEEKNELTTLHEAKENYPVTVFDRNGGPKPIGVVDREWKQCTEDELKEQLTEAGKTLSEKYGEEQFKNELGRKLKRDFIEMQNKPGSYVFIADPSVTLAIMNDLNNSLLIEVRRPGMPYQRGTLQSRRQLGESLGIQSLLEG